MANVITNEAKLTMISAISGSDLKIALLDNIVLSADCVLKTSGSWVDLSAREIPNGNGYTAGGEYLSGTSAYQVPLTGTTASCGRAYFNGDSITWGPNATISSYGYALYRETNNLVISIVAFSGVTQGNPKISTNGPFSVAWTNDKILQMIG